MIQITAQQMMCLIRSNTSAVTYKAKKKEVFNAFYNGALCSVDTYNTNRFLQISQLKKNIFKKNRQEIDKFY